MRGTHKNQRGEVMAETTITKSQLSTLKGKQLGQGLVMFVLMLPVLCGIMGLAIDVGSFYALKRRMQTAADAGAVGGAAEMKKGGNVNKINSAGLNDAALNGMDGTGGEVITVDHPPKTGSRAGDSDFVSVTISKDTPTFFMRVLHINTVKIEAKATAGLIDKGPYCIYVLDPTMKNAWHTDDNVNLIMDCASIVDSKNKDAMHVDHHSFIQALAIDVTGNYGGQSVHLSPKPDTHVAPEDDPLASLPPPAVGPCNFNNKIIPAATVATLNPGVYCGGIQVLPAAQVTFNPGQYVLKGGGLRVTGAEIEGAGVSFYNKLKQASFVDEEIKIVQSKARLSPPTLGGMAGVLFFQDRNIRTSDSIEIKLKGDSKLSGALYFATDQELELENKGNTNTWKIMIIANSFQIMDGSQIRISHQVDPGLGHYLKRARLVE